MASIREAKQHIDDGTDEVAEGVSTAGEAVGDELHRLRAKMHANGAQLEDDLRDAGVRFADGAKKFSEAATEQIRENPLAAFGVAFAAGIVVSRWLRKR